MLTIPTYASHVFVCALYISFIRSLSSVSPLDLLPHHSGSHHSCALTALSQNEDVCQALEQIDKETHALRVRQRRAVRLEARLVNALILYAGLLWCVALLSLLLLFYTAWSDTHWALTVLYMLPLLFFPFLYAPIQHPFHRNPFHRNPSHPIDIHRCTLVHCACAHSSTHSIHTHSTLSSPIHVDSLAVS